MKSPFVNLMPWKILLCLLLLVVFNPVYAQEKWSSPEVAQMYSHACEYSKMGNLNNAIITFKQALTFEPGNLVLYEGLGEACYKERNFKEALQTVAPLLGKKDAGPELYVLVAKALSATGKNKRAITIMRKGFVKFPSSGLLYHELGSILENEKKTGESIDAWNTGVKKEQDFTLNYYELARSYFGNGRFLDGILCGELFVNIESVDTIKVNEIKKMLFTGYKSMFDAMTGDNEQHKKRRTKNVTPYINGEDKVSGIYSKLTPVVSDGITAENLTMVRTRFLMDWFRQSQKDSFLLFTYQDNLVRTGWFDIYNEWLFGYVEDTLQYKAWNTFHPGCIDSFWDWRKNHLPVHKF